MRMKTMSKLLIPVDGSPQADRAVAHVLELVNNWLSWRKNLLRKKTMCLVATVLKLDPRDRVICNQTYGKVVCM